MVRPVGKIIINAVENLKGVFKKQKKKGKKLKTIIVR
jgi:hypothetical protein